MISVKPYTVSVSWIRKGRERLKGREIMREAEVKERCVTLQCNMEAKQKG